MSWLSSLANVFTPKKSSHKYITQHSSTKAVYNLNTVITGLTEMLQGAVCAHIPRYGWLHIQWNLSYLNPRRGSQV